ncbi:Bug family tripartite tricarboxylate transporter substrate binding protein [Ramlibacter sp.]|uniref:Bug family tripartite tricarboxylate transporter substrate binding protein n=1 Tax=Ramlibacter sp. TaxID=1917967 RepID=UPI003D1181E8
MHRRDLMARLGSAALALSAPSLARAQGFPAQAQGFPRRNVTLVVPSSPGGPIDTLARLLQPHLQAMWSMPVVFDYKPGANGVIGTDIVAKAPPDGHTIAVVPTSHVINPSLRTMPFDTAKDLSGVAVLGVSNILIAANPSFPANTLPEAIALIRSQPKKFSYASPGSGSALHLSMELLKHTTGVDVLHVPFRGSAMAYPEVMSGRVNLLVDPLYSALPHVKAGKLKALALTGAKRSALAPDIPTVSELGVVPGFNVQSFFAVVTTGGTPRDVVEKMHRDIGTILQMPETSRRLGELGIEPNPLATAEVDALIRRELDRWTTLVRATGIKAE